MNRDLSEAQCKSQNKGEMAGFYGIQFEALMKEVCEDFGRRLIRGWDEKAEKDEVRNYVQESVEAFFKKTEGLNPREFGIKATVTIEPETKKKAKKKKSEAEIPDSPTGMTDTEEEKPKKKAGTKSKGLETKSKDASLSKDTSLSKKTGTKSKGGKPKCEGVTAKGTKCSKCAVEGEVFCSVHLKKAAADKEEKKTKTKTKPKPKEAPKHTHEPGEEPVEGEECELCEKHGDVFEVPEYEEVDKSELLDEEDDTKGDPNWELTEEDLEELD